MRRWIERFVSVIDVDFTGLERARPEEAEQEEPFLQEFEHFSGLQSHSAAVDEFSSWGSLKVLAEFSDTYRLDAWSGLEAVRQALQLEESEAQARRWAPPPAGLAGTSNTARRGLLLLERHAAMVAWIAAWRDAEPDRQDDQAEIEALVPEISYWLPRPSEEAAQQAAGMNGTALASAPPPGRLLAVPPDRLFIPDEETGPHRALVQLEVRCAGLEARLTAWCRDQYTWETALDGWNRDVAEAVEGDPPAYQRTRQLAHLQAPRQALADEQARCAAELQAIETELLALHVDLFEYREILPPARPADTSAAPAA